jgi:DNA-binding transcriptional LysR family regulator
MQDWNDLRLVLAVQRVGSLTGAALALSIDHSTAFRRLKGLEKRIGVRLFERLPGGVYEATEAGARMAAAAERMEDEALALDRAIEGVDHKPAGRLRVTCSETLAFARLTGHLAAFRRAYPGIFVELAIENRTLSLTRREADVALRPIRPRESDLWGRKLAGVAWTVYGTPDLVAALGPLAGPEEVGGGPIIGWEQGTTRLTAADWLDRAMAGTAPVYRTGSLVNQAIAASEGMGLALLPCYLGDGMDGLVRALAEPIAEVAGELWIVTHADLKATARVRAFFDTVGEALARERDLFEGARVTDRNRTATAR